MDSFEVEVIRVKTKPYFFRERWIVRVEYKCFGRIFNRDLEFKTKELADGVSVGYTFLS